jgi:hypothetical protein
VPPGRRLGTHKGPTTMTITETLKKTVDDLKLDERY